MNWQVLRPGRRAGAGLGLLALAAVVGLAGALSTPPAQAAQTVSPQAIIIGPPPSPPFAGKIWVDQSAYREGDSIRIYFSVSRDAYVYIIDLDTTGTTRLLLPNGYQPSNFMRAGTHSIPDGGYSLQVSGPPGTEYVQLIASSKPVPYLEGLKVSIGGSASFNIGNLKIQASGSLTPFAIVPVPSDGNIAQQILSQLQADKSIEWTTAWTSFEIRSSGFPPPPNRGPVARVSANSTQVWVGDTVEFDATRSYDPDGAIFTYSWDFNGDGRWDASGSRVSYRFDYPGTYTVRLQVQDNQGAIDTDTVVIRVMSKPMVQVELRTSPSGADVYLDGTYMGKSPVRFSTTPGYHDLRVQRWSSQWQTRINLEGLDAISIDVNLE